MADEEGMLVDNKQMKGNSPTPKADAPLAPSAPSEASTTTQLDDIMKMMATGFQNLSNIFNNKLSKINDHLSTVEKGKAPTCWQSANTYYTVDIDYPNTEDNTLDQQATLNNRRHIKEFDMEAYNHQLLLEQIHTDNPMQEEADWAKVQQ